MTRFIYSLLLLVILNSTLSAQIKNKISGKVLDQEAKAVEGAVVNLLRLNGQSLIKATFTEADGKFEFQDVSSDSVKMMINLLGYQNYLSELIVFTKGIPAIELPDITLLNDSKKLEEVSVTAKVPFIERKIDRTIVNPDALISNAGGNALDVLSKSPGIMVDEKGVIKLKGKAGVLVLIDDKPTYLTGEELAAYLKSLPASAIQQLEIMTNPPAKYDAAGNSGIINIKTKRNKLKGLNGNLSLNYAQGRYARTADNISLGYNAGKISISSNLSYSNHNSFHDLTIKRRYKNDDLSTKSIFTQNTYIQPHQESYNAKIGVDYYLNKKTTLGINTKGVFMQSKMTSFNYANFLNADQSINTIVLADNGEKNKFQNGSINLNARHQFDSAATKLLSFDLDYVSYRTHVEQKYANDVYLPDGSSVYTDQQSGNLPSQITIYAFKSDYSQPIKGAHKIDAGIKTSITHTDNDAQYTITQNGITLANYNLSNHFLYDEMINAAYANYSGNYKKLEMQAGLRFESTLYSGRQLGNAIKPKAEFDNNYNSLFPTLYLSYHLDSAARHQFNFSYGKRVNRPFYQDLNPFISPLDKYTYYEGNPRLLPTFAHNLSLAYTYNNTLTATVNYNNANNQIQETIEIKDGIYYSRPGNIGSGNLLSLSLEATIPVRKWLTTTVYTETMHSHYQSKLYTETLDSRGTYWYINANNSFQFNKGWSAEVSGEYITNFIDSQFSFGDFGHITIGGQKKIWNDRGIIRFSLSDVLYTNRIRGVINNLHLTDANWYGPRDTRVASLTFSYRFGNNTNKKAKHNGNGSESEQNRVKS